MVLLSLIPLVHSDAVDWIRPADIRDDLYGLLIYDGNINITFDGTFTVAGGGENDTDTNESIRFENLTAYDCPSGYLVIGIYDNGTVKCAVDAGEGDTNLSSGGIISGDLTIASPYKLTLEGELIIQAIATVMNVTPVTHNLYSLGNSTHWFKSLYATNIYNENLYSNFVNASEVNSTNINSDKINSTTLEVNENLTIGTHVLKKDGEDFILTLN